MWPWCLISNCQVPFFWLREIIPSSKACWKTVFDPLWGFELLHDTSRLDANRIHTDIKILAPCSLRPAFFHMLWSPVEPYATCCSANGRFNGKIAPIHRCLDMQCLQFRTHLPPLSYQLAFQFWHCRFEREFSKNSCCVVQEEQMSSVRSVCFLELG